jgi:hypothetical protein
MVSAGVLCWHSWRRRAWAALARGRGPTAARLKQGQVVAALQRLKLSAGAARVHGRLCQRVLYTVQLSRRDQIIDGVLKTLPASQSSRWQPFV